MADSDQVQGVEEAAVFAEEQEQAVAIEEADLAIVDSPQEDERLPHQEPAAESRAAEEVIPAAAAVPRQARKLAEIIPSQLSTLRQHHYAVVTTDDIEAVHKMRVTTRRLQASLDLLEGEVKVRPLKRRLRKWRRMLSTVRNYDVFLLLIEQEAASRRGAREQFELLKTELQKRRAMRAARVKKYLSNLDLIEELGTKLGLSKAAMSTLWEQPVGADDDSIGEPPTAEVSDVESPALDPIASSDVVEAPAFPAINEQAAEMRAADRLEQRMAEFNALAARSHPTTDPRELHQLRIAAKRVRYLLEAVTDMGFGDASQALTWLRSLQDRIGDWHDLEALEEEIIGLVAQRRLIKEHLAESAAILLAATHLQKRKRLLVSRLFPVRVPAGLSATCRRLVKALRRRAVRS
ncbi:MAG TPA: CHAD domain-containing protein [Blastocatellia bacterium]|nr:CHAD domain-containing protein [Blastocatellia bacterium]